MTQVGKESFAKLTWAFSPYQCFTSVLISNTVQIRFICARTSYHDCIALQVNVSKPFRIEFHLNDLKFTSVF